MIVDDFTMSYSIPLWSLIDDDSRSTPALGQRGIFWPRVKT